MMPPRKSDSSKVATGDEGSVAGFGAGTSTGPSVSAKKEDGVNIEVMISSDSNVCGSHLRAQQDLNLPKSVVTRLAKGVLPPNTQIQGNAMLALSKSATVFVNYLSTNANEYAQNANRKTIAPADVFKALEDLDFDFKDRLEAELAKFNEIQTDKRNTYRKKVAADKASVGAKSGSPAGDGERNGVAVEADASGEPAAKKPRMDADADLDHARDEVEDTSDLVDEPDLGEDGGEEAEDEPDVDDMEDEEEDAGEIDDPPEDALEEPEERDAGDEALDNGEDSD